VTVVRACASLLEQPDLTDGSSAVADKDWIWPVRSRLCSGESGAGDNPEVAYVHVMCI
jgi:hypothetical protein